MKLSKAVIMSSLGLALCLSTANLSAQENQRRRDFDPEQMRQRMMERYREQLEVKSDDEWKLISSRIEKINEARMAIGFGGGRGGFGRGPRPGGDGDNAQRGDNNQGGGGRRGGPRGEPNPDVEALQKAVESKASADEIKAKLEKVREARKAQEAKLEKAQEELRKVLTVRQEASAVLAGLLK